MPASTAELASRSAACACAAASPARTTRLVVTRLLAIDRMDSLLEPSTGRRRAKSPSPLVMRRGGEATGSIGVSVWLASGGETAERGRQRGAPVRGGGPQSGLGGKRPAPCQHGNVARPSQLRGP